MEFLTKQNLVTAPPLYGTHVLGFSYVYSPIKLFNWLLLIKHYVVVKQVRVFILHFPSAVGHIGVWLFHYVIVSVCVMNVSFWCCILLLSKVNHWIVVDVNVELLSALTNQWITLETRATGQWSTNICYSMPRSSMMSVPLVTFVIVFLYFCVFFLVHLMSYLVEVLKKNE